MYWYILFVFTGQEYKVEQILKKQMYADASIPFVPMLEVIYKISGRIKKETKPLFPGYVFIESGVPSLKFINMMCRVVFFSQDIIRILKYADTGEIAIRESEKRMLLRLCNNERCIESSTGIIEGDSVYIKEGPLKGLESIVKKIDRHKRRAFIELEFMGEVRQVSLALVLDIVEKKWNV